MCKASVLVVLCGVIAGSFAQYSPQRIRTTLNFNVGWKFIKQDVAVATATGTSEPGWSNINLPHAFNIPNLWTTTKAAAPYVGWYRKHFTVDQSAKEVKKRFTLEFEGSFLVTTVYVNGTQVGQHKGGYTPFAYDITSQLNAGDNIIAVRVDGSWQYNVAPRGGDHTFIGGIYRNVSLIVTEPLHVDWYGTFVTTPSVSSAAATVKVNTEIKNNNSTAKTCSVISIIVDSTSTIVASQVSSSLSVPADAIDTFVQTGITISSPHLWTPSTPYLYKVYTEVYDGTQLVDNYVSSLGVRSVAWSSSAGFSINGQHLWLHGANAHQDHAGWGNGITNSGNERDVKLIKNCGMNFIRGSHYPHAPSFVDACDKYGICFWSEMCFWFSSTGGDSTDWKMDGYPSNNTNAQQNDFDNNVLLQTHEMIKVYRNHPSIVIWSMCNEPFFGGNEARIKALLTQMIALSHKEDSTRLAAIGGCQRDYAGTTPSYYKLGDVAGLNGDGATNVAGFTFVNPGIANMVTEYGSCGEDRPGSLDACWGDVQTTNDSANQYAWRSGISLWAGFHYSSWSGYGNTGMIDHSRLPLRRWYYYRNKNLGIANPAWPATGTAARLAITTDLDTITDDGKTDAQVIVQIQNSSGTWISNTANITLTTTNGLFPSQAPAGGTSITFNAGAQAQGVREGMCAIEFRSYSAGTATLTATSGSITATKTIVVNHVSDPAIVYTTSIVPGQHAIAPVNQITRQQRFIGKNLMIPADLRDRECSVAIYSLQGKLLKEMQLKGHRSSIKVDNAASFTMIARFKTN